MIIIVLDAILQCAALVFAIVGSLLIRVLGWLDRRR